MSQISGQIADTTVYAYDLNGNLLSIVDGNYTDQQPTQRYYYYDGTNRLRCIADGGTAVDDIDYTPSGSMEYYVADDMRMRYNHYEQLSHRETDGDVERDSVDYWYNAAGQRVAKRYCYTFMGWCPPDSVGADPDLPGLDGMTMLSGGVLPEMRPCPMEGMTWTGFNYLGDDLLMEYHGPYDGQLVGNYVYANGTRIARFGNPGQPEKVQYYLSDHLGSVVGAVRRDGHLVQHNFYRPWGEKLEASIAFGEPEQFQYTGQYLDEDLAIDWYYYGSRYYDPGLKVFTSVDPRWSESPGWGSYVYCRNNPVKYVDPDGETFLLSPGLAEQKAQFEQDHPILSWIYNPFDPNNIVPEVGIIAPAKGPAARVGTKVASKIEKFLSSVKEGLRVEKKALEREGLVKNTKALEALDPKTGKSGKTIPDAVLEDGRPVDVKNHKYLRDSPQLRRQSKIASEAGKRAVILQERPGGRVVSAVRKRMDVLLPGELMIKD